jgi:hypothetical protein
MWITWKHDAANLSWPLAFEEKVNLFYEQVLAARGESACVTAGQA